MYVAVFLFVYFVCAGETNGATCLEHIVTSAGDATVFNCLGGLRWVYKPFGNDSNYKLGNGDVPANNSHYTDSYVIQKMSQNGINLQINSTLREDAGTFTCHVRYDNEPGYTTSAELVILDSAPMCHQVDPEISDSYSVMQCRVNFTLNWVPEMEWIWENGTTITHGVSCYMPLSEKVGGKTCFLTVNVTSEDTKYLCRTRFISKGRRVTYPSSPTFNENTNYDNNCTVDLEGTPTANTIDDYTHLDDRLGYTDNSSSLFTKPPQAHIHELSHSTIIALYVGCAITGVALVSMVLVFIVQRKNAREQGTYHVPYKNHNDYVELPTICRSADVRPPPPPTTNGHVSSSNSQLADQRHNGNEIVGADGTIYAQVNNAARREWLLNNPPDLPIPQRREEDTSEYASLDHLAMANLC